MDDNIVEWDDKYSVGIELIDKQHSELVKMTNELFEGCKLGTQEAKVYFENTMHKAVDYVKGHFATEEKLLEKLNYPELQIHKKQHEDFILTVLSQVKAFQSGEKFVPNNFVRYLREWVLEHIAVSDHKYAEYIKRLRKQQTVHTS